MPEPMDNAKRQRRRSLPKGGHVAKVPQMVNVLGLAYEVAREDLDDENGFIDPRRQRIVISSRISDERAEQTFFHELLHGIFDQLGREDLYEDEQLVQTLAVGLHQSLASITSCA